MYFYCLPPQLCFIQSYTCGKQKNKNPYGYESSPGLRRPGSTHRWIPAGCSGIAGCGPACTSATASTATGGGPPG